MSLREHTLFGIEDKVRDAVKVLQENEPPEGYYVAFSGGKDSLCVYWLTKIAGVKCDYHYNFTTIDPPELVAFVRTFEDVEIHHPGVEKTFWNLILDYLILPSGNIRYCCRVLKETGGKKRIKLLGVREAESTKRKGRAVINFDSPLGKIINLIYYWSDEDVWEFIHCNLIEYCSLYDEGFDRLGCVGCPLKSTRLRERDFERYPLYKKNLLNTMEKTLELRRQKGLSTNYKTAEEWFDWWLYGKKQQQENQLELFEEVEE